MGKSSRLLPPIPVGSLSLIELLVVIGILAILLTIVLIAINPARQFGLSNDTKRRSEVLSILNSVHQFAADPANRGVLPAQIPTGVVGTDDLEICGNAAAPATCANLCGDIVPDYISALPVDPETGTGTPITDCTVDYNTGYYIVKDTDGRVTVSAPNTSQYTTPDISIRR